MGIKAQSTKTKSANQGGRADKVLKFKPRLNGLTNAERRRRLTAAIAEIGGLHKADLRGNLRIMRRPLTSKNLSHAARRRFRSGALLPASGRTTKPPTEAEKAKRRAWLLEQCERLRQECNNLTGEQRRQAREYALQIIYGTNATASPGRR